MATPLTVDNAKYAIGRIVRVREKENSQLGAKARLIKIEGEYGIVKMLGHESMMPSRYPIEKLADDTTANGVALYVPPPPPPPPPKPVRVPQQSTIELKDQARAAGRDELKDALAEAELTDFGDFAAKVKAAAADVSAANRMYKDLERQQETERIDMETRHSTERADAKKIAWDAVQALTALKSKANSLLNLFDGANS